MGQLLFVQHSPLASPCKDSVLNVFLNLKMSNVWPWISILKCMQSTWHFSVKFLYKVSTTDKIIDHSAQAEISFT